MSPRWRQWLMVFGFFVVGALAYRPAFNAFFLADDFFFLSYVREQGLKAAWTCFPRDFLRPMVMGSFWWDSTLWGLNGWGFHLTNVLFHTLNALLVASLAEFWLKQNGWDSLRAQWLAPLAGLIFLVHPSHTEAVSWISGRSDVLAVFWGLSSLLAYLRWRSSGRRLWLPGAWCLFGLALLSKESMITLPLIILLLERFSPNPPSSNIRRWTPAAGYIAVVLLYGAARWAVLGAIIGGYGESIHMRFDRPFWIRNLLFYTTRTVLPVGEWRIHESVLFYGKIILWMTASLGIVQLLFRRRAKDGDSIRRLFLPEWFWMLAGMYLFSLLPVINLGVHLGTSLGERFIYWPSVFAVLLIVCLCDVLLRRRQWGALGVLTAIILIYTATLYRANWIWQEAGQISRQLLVDIQEYSTADRLFVLNVPDTLHGSYVLRGGLEIAAAIWRPEADFGDFYILSYQKIDSMQDGASVRKKEDGIFEVINEGASSYFVRRVNAKEHQPFVIRSFQREGYEIQFNAILPDDRLIYYRNGHLYPAPSSS